MKNFKIFIVSLLVLFGCSTAVLAQRHRQTERNDSSENAILKKDIKVSGHINTSVGGNADSIDFDIASDFDGIDEQIERLAAKADRWAEKYQSNDNEAKIIGGFLGFLVFLVGFLFIVCPLFLIGFIIWLLCRPSKKKKEEERNVCEISSDPDTITIKAEACDEAIVKRRSYEKESKKGEKSMTEKGIMKIAIGAGLFCASLFIQIELLAAIGVFVLIYGAGQLAIGKFTEKKDERTE